MPNLRAPVLTGLAIIFVGAFVITHYDLYGVYPHLDKLLHISGGVIVAWFFSIYWKDKLKAYSLFDRLVLCAAMAALVGFFWEAAEYSTSLELFDNYSFMRKYLYIGSLLDTLGDFMADIFGAALFAFLYRR